MKGGSNLKNLNFNKIELCFCLVKGKVNNFYFDSEFPLSFCCWCVGHHRSCSHYLLDVDHTIKKWKMFIS